MSEESGNGGVVSGLFVLLFIILVPVLSFALNYVFEDLPMTVYGEMCSSYGESSKN